MVIRPSSLGRLFVLVADGLAKSTAAFLSGDRVAATKIAAADVVIDELQHGTETLVVQQLRNLVSAPVPMEFDRS